MFQNVNVAKSAPFALLTIYQKKKKIRTIRAINYIPKKKKNPCIPPKFSKLPPHFGKLREIRRPFFDLNNEKWNPPISQQIARKLLNSPPKQCITRNPHNSC